jgi:hypothetical protein
VFPGAEVRPLWWEARAAPPQDRWLDELGRLVVERQEVFPHSWRSRGSRRQRTSSSLSGGTSSSKRVGTPIVPV